MARRQQPAISSALSRAEEKKALKAAADAALAAGKLMRSNLHSTKRVNADYAHDIKLELDVRCQDLITKALHRRFPTFALLGEEGISGDVNAQYRWVVDPIDGTVNFAYGIPHACVSIAMEAREANGTYASIVGVVYDPFANELWTAIRGQKARLNGKLIHVSTRKSLGECIVSVGFAKSHKNLELTLPYFERIARRARKMRVMGAAALALTYVASGRFDAYVESGIRLWDIAAGGLIVECAGGEFWREPIAGPHAYRLVASNGLLRKKLQSLKK